MVQVDAVGLVRLDVEGLRLDRLGEDLYVVVRLDEKPQLAFAPEQKLLQATVEAHSVDLLPELLQRLERLSVNHRNLLLVRHAQQRLAAANVEHLVLAGVLVDQLQIFGVEKVVLELAVLHKH